MSWFAILMLVLGLFIGYNEGWLKAHNTIAIECQRLGSFYVGNKVYVCTNTLRKEVDK